ncbi:MAG: Gfo/Idh/MocA family oxidoreductase [Pseudobdellovibrionaceae bacterium]|nr:Gfo/Idh/MocA family oxidoreductase [Pseudobdellovibrionaceae bacterium]
MNSFKLAFVGMGRQTLEYLLPVIRQFHFEPIAFVSRTRRPADFCQAHHLVQLNDLSALKAWGATHLFIAVHRRINGRLVAAALDSGFTDIFVEKPPATSLEELDSLIAKVVTRQARVHVGMNFRYATLVREAQRIMASCDGLIDLDLCFDGKTIMPQSGEHWAEAMLLEFAIHAIDLAQALTPDLNWFTLDVKRWAEGTQVLYFGEAGERTATLRVRTGRPMFSSQIRLMSRNASEVTVVNFAEITTQMKSIQGLDSPLRSSISLQTSPRDLGLNRAGYYDMVKEFLWGGTGITLRIMRPTFQIMEKALVSIH